MLLGGRKLQHPMARKVAPECVTKAEECSFTHVRISASVIVLRRRFIYTTWLLISSTNRWTNCKLSGMVYQGLHFIFTLDMDIISFLSLSIMEGPVTGLSVFLATITASRQKNTRKSVKKKKKEKISKSEKRLFKSISRDKY